MNAVAVIPARYGSTRYPGKPLLRETGKFLIQHVYEQAAAAKSLGAVIVATDDERIADAVRSFGGRVAMTRSDHASGTDRIAEVVRGLSAGECDIVLNVQGDEPELDPTDLDRLVRRMEADPALESATLACPFADDTDPRDPNAVKVVRSAAGLALYFSRALIPYPRDDPQRVVPGDWLLHLGVYAYRRQFLERFAAIPQSRLEQVEKLEQLRVLEGGYSMAVEVVARASPGVDTPADYERFVARWRSRSARG